MKRQVTEEELNAAYAVVQAELAKLASSAALGAESEAVELLAPAGAKPESVGVHIGPERTNILFLAAKHAVVSHTAINVGYEDVERLLKELLVVLQTDNKSKPTLYITLTGKPSHFVTVKLPKMARGQMVKAFRVQLKNSSGNDFHDLEYAALPAQKKGDDQVEYAVGGIDKSIVEKIFRHLKSKKYKVVAWDTDMFCYARAANFLWQKNRIEKSTRFLVLLDWDSTRLLIQSADGRLISSQLPIGINSFLDHLLKTWEALTPTQGTDAVGTLGAEPIELRERNILANQAIHDVYVPLGQQIKTQLFAGCNEHGVPLPTHFCVISTGANLFRLIESLSLDLGLVALNIEKTFPIESAAALGATLWDKADLRLNFLPRGNQEAFRTFREMLLNLKNFMPKRAPLELPPGMSATAGIAAIVGTALGALIMVGWPLWKRHQVTKILESRRKELAALQGEKERIRKAKEREEIIDRKLAMVKLIASKKPEMTKALTELFSIIPPEVRLHTFTMKENLLNLKGLSKNPIAVESFLRKALELKLLHNPVPLGIKRNKDSIEFEIIFRYQG